jgi:SAM-dependent methyltransferase
MCCKSCKFIFFNPRFEAEELAVLYSGYRDENYQKQRQAYEKEYTPELNHAIGFHPAQIQSRKKNLLEILKSNVDVNRINDVLDFGGDKGQYIPDEIPKKFVYEISDVEPVPGVTMFKKLPDKKFDFIMCSHVLEHVPFPSEVVEQIKKVANQDSVIYFEVPYEIYSQNLLKRLAKQAWFTVPALFRIVWMPTMHEHVNIFCLNSLKRLCFEAGLEVFYIQIKGIDRGWTRGEVICCLARLNRKK